MSHNQSCICQIYQVFQVVDSRYQMAIKRINVKYSFWRNFNYLNKIFLNNSFSHYLNHRNYLIQIFIHIYSYIHNKNTMKGMSSVVGWFTIWIFIGLVPIFCSGSENAFFCCYLVHICITFHANLASSSIDVGLYSLLNSKLLSILIIQLL